MPKLPQQQILEEHDDGTRYSTDVDASVGNDGTFSLAIPPELDDIVHNRKRIGNAHVGQHNSNCPYRIYAKSLGEALNFLRECAKEYLAAETKRERVIIYRVKLEVAAWIEMNGVLAPNGSVAVTDAGQWWKTKTQKYGGPSATSRVDEYSVGIVAHVYDKVTSVRKSGNLVRWERAEDRADSAVERLNGFVGLDRDPEHGDWQEMPYSPEAAEFFTKIMLGLAQLAMNIDAFFSDEKRMKAAIESGSANLLGFTKG